ncbi:Disease resistance-like protein DSC1 [Camellia lanceoleosa]|uniref:Disease resistance-like protein DSC1 n=1 Tax=Camellia lanceoleosa TaxID=1840588 RepID=A0ACC0I9Y1_9ERIC|nr:Disease resistance-like protein DSC1 [Camellia lanceoleosa]
MDNLIDRCLLTITQKILTMHQLLQDMGRYIVQQQSSNELGKCRLLGRHEDSFNVLRRKIGTKKIEGLYLDMHVLEKESWFNKTFCDLEIDAFASMENLILLMLNGVEIKGGYKEFPKRLRWLSWHEYSQKSIPSDFSLESLVGLELRNSKLEHVWKGTRLLISLKVLNLSHSHGLRTTPNFTGLPNLEDLILENCIRLVEVHESISELERLVFLNLKGCKNLKKLPCKIGHLKSLEKLDLSGCSNLDQFPTELEKIKSLKMLNVDGIDINKIQSTTSNVKPWSWLFNPFLPKPRKCSESICFSLASLASCMVSLSLSNCTMSYDDLVKVLGRFSLLQDLDLSENPISSLPESIKGLIGLQSLRLSHCRRLQSLPELPMGLELLDVDECSSLEMITNLPNWTTYLDLTTDGCEKLVEVQGIFKLEPIGNADAKIVNSLGLTELESMGSLEVDLRNNITDTQKKYLLQGSYECGIYNIFLPGSEVPGWSSNKRSGPSISFTVPSVTSLSDLKIQALNVYVLYTFANEDSEGDGDFECIVIRNKTKGHTWHHSPAFICRPNKNNDVVWLSHWMIAHQLMEVGDDVNLSVHLVEGFKVKEVGFQIMYDEHPENVGDRLEYFSDMRDDNFPCHHQRHHPCF